MVGLDLVIRAFFALYVETWMADRRAGHEIGRVRIVEDFLPSPDRPVLRENNVKVTLSLSQRSLAFFKRAARQRRVPYQRMIRALVDAYAEKEGGKG